MVLGTMACFGPLTSSQGLPDLKELLWGAQLPGVRAQACGQLLRLFLWFSFLRFWGFCCSSVFALKEGC